MQISNKPNIKGMEKVATDATYRTAVMGRDLRLMMGLINTRLLGISLGIIIAVALVLIPALYEIYIAGGTI